MELKKMLASFGFIILIPAVIIFDSLFYFMTRPSCLNCGSLADFLKNSSMTMAMLGSVGYKLRGNKK